MDLDMKKIETWVLAILKKIEEEQARTVVLGISNRHIHLSQEHVDILFGKGYQLTFMKELKQPGQYAAKETVTLEGPKGLLFGVRVLGPIRQATQVEVSMTDSFALGVAVPVRESGDLAGTPGVIIRGPKGQVEISEGLIIAARHIHMPADHGTRHGYQDGEQVSVYFDQGMRKTTFHNVKIRVSDKFELEMHLDLDEANAAGLKNGMAGTVIKETTGAALHAK